MNTRKQIAQTILSELSQFGNDSIRQFDNSKTVPITGAPKTDKIYEAKKYVNANELLVSKEPFIAYVKVREKETGSEWQEKIYLVCRNYQPMKNNPKTHNATFLSRNAPAGVIASTEVGDEGTYYITRYTRRIARTFEVLERNVFIPRKQSQWDAINNNMSYRFEDEFIPSLRGMFSVFEELSNPVIPAEETFDDTLGLNVVKEIEDLEARSEEDKNERILAKQLRKKVINDSMTLKDQPILDKFQDTFCRLHLSSQILLLGSPGTGKTTTLIKRLNYKSDINHLMDTDEILLDDEQLQSWRMFTPNELLKMYLKEAMVKEGLQATDDKVVTWENERTNLGRHILKFFKTPKSGIFSRATGETFADSSSEKLTKHAADFIDYFNSGIQNNFSETTDFLEKNTLPPDIIEKDNFKLADKYNKFVAACKRIAQSGAAQRVSDIEIKTIYLIDRFQAVTPELTEIRSGIRELIRKVINDFIVRHSEVIEKVSQIIAESKVQPDSAERPETIETAEATDENELEEFDEEEVNDEAGADIRLEAARLIRQSFLRYAEGIALRRPLKNKRQLRVWELMSPYFSESKLLDFIGRISISVRRKIFGQLDYSRILEQMPLSYDKFRQELFKSETSDTFESNSAESIRSKKISLNETDVLIYTMLRFAAKIFQEKRDFLRESRNFEILENIKSQYRTQIAVDEAADFSAVQLGSMFHLAHPDYKSVSFAGDLMQRVTRSGLKDWKECEFIAPNFKTEELLVSYRQTPVLLQIAGKLYENIIGQEANFYSKDQLSEQDPQPLKFAFTDDDELGDWITERVHEIYEIHKPNFPTIAIFVAEEAEIDPLYDILLEKLNDISVDVEKCKEGKVLGTGSKVRIFSVEYIKGLEFEGVFFVGIDDIHERKPDLLDKYLYVGLTRASTFLGVTYKTEFPAKIDFVKNDFSSGDWSEFI